MSESSAASKISFDSIRSDNETLATEIRTYVAQQTAEQQNSGGEGDAALKGLIRKLYGRICDFSLYQSPVKTPDKKIVAAWESFLGAIGALADVQPHGKMIAARMVLYLANAFGSSEQLSHTLVRSSSTAKAVELRCDFLIAMDEALLACLIVLWTQSGNRERYEWVFSDYPVQQRCARNYSLFEDLPKEIDFTVPRVATVQESDEKMRERIEAACVTNPAHLPPVSPPWPWVRREGDRIIGPRNRRSRSLVDSSAECWQRLGMWECVGDGGPIRAKYVYDVVDEGLSETYLRDREDEEMMAHRREREMLQRSRQFILDARRLAARRLFLETRAAAQEVLVRTRRLPVELQSMIMALVDAEEPSGISLPGPYLSKLDLAQVYRPFPARPGRRGKCDVCSAAPDDMVRSTCPRKALTVWSLPLRIFHTLHKTGPSRASGPVRLRRASGWRVCALENCNGHHQDESWHTAPVLGEPAWSAPSFLDAIVSARCGAPGTTTTLSDVGLGPLDPVVLLNVDEDEERQIRLFDSHGRTGTLRTASGEAGVEMLDHFLEAKWSGLGGLLQVVGSRRVVYGACPATWWSGPATWALGRTRHEERRALNALRVFVFLQHRWRELSWRNGQHTGAMASWWCFAARDGIAL